MPLTIALVQRALQQIQSSVKQPYEQRHICWDSCIDLPTEIVLPEVDNQKLGLFSIGKAIEESTSFMIARAATDHLRKLDTRLDGAHEHQIYDLWNVDAGIEHVD